MTRFASLLVLASLALPVQAGAQALRVVTSTTDLHDIAHRIGGNRVHAVSITVGYQDPHFVEAKPSYVLELRKADVFAFIGLDLEVGWMSLLLEGARNRDILPGGRGHLDVSRAIPVLDADRGPVDRSQGDVHPRGNPHYWLDPANGVRIAHLFRDTFTALDPAGAELYARNTREFEQQLIRAAVEWADEMAAIRDKPVVAWHTSWRYLAEYASLDIVGFIEPKPGVPPSPSHLAQLIQTIRRTGAKAIIMEPWYDRRTADLVAQRTGAQVLVLPPSVGAVKGVDGYLELLAHNFGQLAAVLK